MISQTSAPARVKRRYAQPRALCSGNEFEILLLHLLDISHRQRTPLRTVGITSCRHGEGVSTVAVNLAIHAAQVLSSPVLLVETNTENRSLERLFGVEQSPGLADVLSEQAAMHECVRQTDIENLSILGAGSRDNFRGAFHLRSVKSVFEELGEQFELVIADLPPTREFSPCLVIAAQLDGVLLTVEAERVSSQITLRAKQQLLQVGASLLGVVFNKRRQHVPR